MLLSLGWASIASAGHLFTQAGSNTPINLTAGFGISITQDSYENSASNGRVTIDFNDEITTNDPTKDWSAGDEITVTIGSWSQKYAFDSSGADGDLTGYSQDGGNINITSDATLVAANITPADGDTWTVVANAGSFTFSGYRIYVDGMTFNGTGAGPINQNQVVTAESLGGGGVFEPAADSNQTQLGRHLDEIADTVDGDLAVIIEGLEDLSEEERTEAMKLISPEQSSAFGLALSSVSSTSLDTVQVRLESVNSGNLGGSATGMSSGDEMGHFVDHNVWMKFIGGKAMQDQKDGFAGADSDFSGIMMGMDGTTEESLTLGAAFAYAMTDVDMNDFRSGDSADIETYQLTGYFRYPVNGIDIDGMMSYAQNDYSTSRNTHISGIARANFDGEMYSARLTASYPISYNENVIIPYVGLETVVIKQDGYSETGAGALSLNVDGISAHRYRSLMGVKYKMSKLLNDGSVLTPVLAMNWRHEFKDDGVNTVSSFSGGGGSFESIGQSVNDDVLGLSAQLVWKKTDTADIGVSLDGEFAEGYKSANIQLYGSWKF